MNNNSIQSIVLLGAGNVATHLGEALSQNNYSIVQIFSRTEQSGSELANKLGCPFITDLQKLNQEADLYIFAVSDDAIPNILKLANFQNKKVIHTAGSVPLEIFADKAKAYGVFYPLQTFTKTHKPDFSQIPILLESNNTEFLEEITNLAGTLSKYIYNANSEERQIFHISAVFTCNFTNHMCSIGESLLSEYGYSFSLLYPLIKETLEKIFTGSPFQNQTGPAIRNDNTIINKHQQQLANKPDLQKLYTTITNHIKHFHQKNN